jgi:uncharacterized caspase-like protein
MLKRHLPSLLMPVLVAAVLALSVRAHAQTRVALVVGNSAYQKVVNLANPAHDAQDVSESLKRLGFAVKTVIDADFDGFRRALLEFGRMAPNAEMAVFYFAGHGVEINGNNWLLPTNVELTNDADPGTEAIGLQSAMQAVAAAKTLGLVILDACRNNPFQPSWRRSGAVRSVQMLGLAPVEPADNVLVAYAARHGTVAADGAGRNSPYTAALLKHIEAPGLEVDFLFRNVRDDVMAATNNEQQPFVYGSLSSDEIYFNAPPAALAAGEAPPLPDAAEIAWSFLRATNDVSTLNRFVDRFPESSHVSEAKERIALLGTAPAPSATDVSSPPLVHPAAFADTELEQTEKAVARRFVRDTPAVEQAWDVVKETKDHTVIRHFVDRFPSKTRRVAADTRLDALGQKPITVHAASSPPLDVDAAVLDRASADPNVHRCFRGNDRTTADCRRAFERFPDIGRFAEDTRFTINFCQQMGNPSGCMPTVMTAWNFPSPNPSGGLTARGGGTGGGTGGGGSTGDGTGGGGTGRGGTTGGESTGGGTGRGGTTGGGSTGGGTAVGDGKHHKSNGSQVPAVAKAANGTSSSGSGTASSGSGTASSGSGTGSSGSHGRGLGKYPSATGALKQGGEANLPTTGIKSADIKTTGIKTTGIKTTDIKTTGIKTTGIKITGVGTTGIKAPTIPTPVVRTPNVKVDVKVPNIPNIPVRVH